MEHASGQLNDQATVVISLTLMFMKYDMLKFENCLKEKHQMLTYFNFALSLEFWSQQGLKYLLVHKDKIIPKIVLRKVYIY